MRVGSGMRLGRKLAVAGLLVGLLATGPAITPAAAAGPLPYGWLDDLHVTPSGELAVRGWGVDDDAPTTPVLVQVFDGQTLLYQDAAAGYRPDVAADHPHVGNDHGFDLRLPVGEGPRRICVYLVNVGPGDSHPQLGCRDVVARTPYGSVEVAYPLRPARWTSAVGRPTPTAPNRVR